jgi:hypothetical protein
MTTVATDFDTDELAKLDEVRRAQRTSREEAIRTAVQWYARWADRLPCEEPSEDEMEA